MNPHPNTERVRVAAADAGVPITIRTFPDGTRTAADAAAALGCEVAQIVKSMIFDADGELVLALTSGANQVDSEKLAALAGVARCGRADADQVRATTGYAIGGVPPFGHDHAVRTWIDPTLLDLDEVFAAAGTPRDVFAVEPTTLAEITGAVIADFV